MEAVSAGRRESEMQIANKVVLITGASRGIGAASAGEFRRRGAQVCLTGRDEDALARQARQGELRIAGDLSDTEFRAHLIAAVLDRLGRIDILVNNAGYGIFWPPSAAPVDEVRAMFEVNVIAPLALSHLVLPAMRSNNSGCIVNISSIGAEVMLPWISLYCASKSAASAMSAAVRCEVAGSGIHVMTVCPGYVSTEFKSNARGPHPPAQLMGPGKFGITTDECAKAIVRGVERNARMVVTPRIGWLLVLAQRMLPGWMESRMTSYFKNMQKEVA